MLYIAFNQTSALQNGSAGYKSGIPLKNTQGAASE